MRKNYYLFPLLLLFLSGCSLFRQPAVLVSSILDYSEYSKQGMFLSESNSVSFNYEPIASVSAIQLSGYKVGKSGEKVIKDDTYQLSYQESFSKLTNEYITATEEKLLEELVKSAKEKGANGVVNLKIKPVFNTYKGYITLVGYEGTGMAIKK